MSENTGRPGPLNWSAFVKEALRRRKAEGLTQREHAALAGVSVPTIAAFDRGERTLTLTKAFDILQVVGLIEEPDEANAQTAFVQESIARWRQLVDALPPDSPARFPHGHYRVDYHLDGELREVSLTEFEGILRQAEQPHTGWPAFIFLTRPESKPREIDGGMECWLSPSPDKSDRLFRDAAHSDFWRAMLPGRLALMRGYEEDGQDTFPPGTIFDTTLPVWRLGEVLLHAEKLASLMRARNAPSPTVRFRAVYSGLTGRILRPWANPMSDLAFEGRAARSDEATLELAVPAETITDRLADYLFPMIASLFERFGVAGLSPSRVEAEARRLLSNRVC